MEIIIPSKYVKSNENIHQGDIVKIKDEGKYSPGKFGPQLELKLGLANGEVKTYTPNTQTQINLKQAFGSDSKEWIDQPLKAWIFESLKGGEMKLQLVLTPEDWDKPAMKQILNPSNSDNQEEVVDVDKISF